MGIPAQFFQNTACCPLLIPILKSQATDGEVGHRRRLHYKVDLFWLQYLDILSLLPGGLVLDGERK